VRLSNQDEPVCKKRKSFSCRDIALIEKYMEISIRQSATLPVRAQRQGVHLSSHFIQRRDIGGSETDHF